MNVEHQGAFTANLLKKYRIPDPNVEKGTDKMKPLDSTEVDIPEPVDWWCITPKTSKSNLEEDARKDEVENSLRDC